MWLTSGHWIHDSCRMPDTSTKSANNTMVAWSSRRQDALLLSKLVSTNDGSPARLIFQLLRQEDLSISTAWHSIWHGSERTP